MNERSQLRFADIEPRCILRTLLANLWVIAAAALSFAMLASLYLTWFHTPVYSASMTYVVTSRNSTYSAARNITAASEVAAVFTQLLESDVVTGAMTAAEPTLAGSGAAITASQVGESNFITVRASANTPKTAFLALNALVECFPSLSDYVSHDSVIQVASKPSVSSAPQNRVDTRRTCGTAAVIGALLMTALILAMNVWQETIQTRDGARRRLDAGVIAAIGHENQGRSVRSLFRRSGGSILISSPSVSFLFTEEINALRSRVEHENRRNGSRVFLITSVTEHEGKSTVAANLAISLARKKLSVALIDGDLRKPSQNAAFGGKYSASMPLSKLLAEPFSLKRTASCIQRDSETGVDMLFSLKRVTRSVELIQSGAMPELLDALRRSYDYIIIDTPPAGMFPDAEVLADMADASILVVRQDLAPAGAINDTINTLRCCKAAFLGCVLNDMLGLASKLYGGYGYGYGRKYGYGYGESDRGSKNERGRKA